MEYLNLGKKYVTFFTIVIIVGKNNNAGDEVS